ncbi:ABC transporter permease [Rossellomorea vietnamensis]|uniref:ABC transporter permease n=1 Tax=Rossellomorea vietnamensis TaxID=218284 RepID=UPI003CECAF23
MRNRTAYKWSVFICAAFVVLMVGGSLVFNNIFEGEIPQTTLKFDESGNLIGGAPFKPSLDFPFGTDRNGYDMFFKVLQGAQYTLGAAILISILSFLISFVFGIAGGFRNSRSKYVTQSILTSFYFIPQSIIAYNVLYPLLWETSAGFQTTFTERVMWQIVTLALITVPTTAILISNETREILQKEFILSARVLGGSKFFLFRKHLLPHLKMRLFIIFPKIIIQALLIIAHLGFFTLFFGGTDVCYEPFCDPPKPFVQEWAGMMAMNYKDLFNASWIFMVPMLFFSLTILSLNGITKGLEGLSTSEKRKKGTFLETDREERYVSDSKDAANLFRLISKS